MDKPTRSTGAVNRRPLTNHPNPKQTDQEETCLYKVSVLMGMLRFVLGAPAPPSSILAFRDTDSSVSLQWQEPKDEEGVLGYYLYRREKGQQDWKVINNKPISEPRWQWTQSPSPFPIPSTFLEPILLFAHFRFTVHGLQTRKEYVFRVKSVSQAGKSDYSDESLPILVKAAICKCLPVQRLL